LGAGPSHCTRTRQEFAPARAQTKSAIRRFYNLAVAAQHGRNEQFEFLCEMVYEWEKYQQTCYQLYIEQKKSLEEIMDVLRVQHSFTPR
jgi:hypothetical protein